MAPEVLSSQKCNTELRGSNVVKQFEELFVCSNLPRPPRVSSVFQLLWQIRECKSTNRGVARQCQISLRRLTFRMSAEQVVPTGSTSGRIWPNVIQFLVVWRLNLDAADITIPVSLFCQQTISQFAFWAAGVRRQNGLLQVPPKAGDIVSGKPRFSLQEAIEFFIERGRPSFRRFVDLAGCSKEIPKNTVNDQGL